MGSNKTLDRCGNCNGDNSTCKHVNDYYRHRVYYGMLIKSESLKYLYYVKFLKNIFYVKSICVYVQVYEQSESEIQNL